MSDKSTIENKEDNGKYAFQAILILIPLIIIGSIVWLGFNLGGSQGIPANTVTQYSRDAPYPPVTSITYYSPTISVSPTLGLGIFDPALGKLAGYAVGPLIALIGALIETSLLLIYGAFYINNGTYANEPLGLPPGIVRVFVVIIVSLTLLTFTLLPDAWGSNKAVSFLLGLFSTIIGFYFGSHNDATVSTSATQAAPATGHEVTPQRSEPSQSGAPLAGPANPADHGGPKPTPGGPAPATGQPGGQTSPNAPPAGSPSPASGTVAT